MKAQMKILLLAGCGLLTLASCPTQAQNLQRVNHSFVIAPSGTNQYVVQGWDQWKITTASGADDLTMIVSLVEALRGSPSGVLVASGSNASPGRADANATATVGSSACLYAMTTVTATPLLGGSPFTLGDQYNGEGCTDPPQQYPGPTCSTDPGGSGRGDPENQDPGTCEPLDPCCAGSPVILNIDGGGFDLCGTDDPVEFDLLVVGHLQHFSWISRRSGDGFLVLDRNGNGRIDDGAELFGNHTRLPDHSVALNGYQALAAFDSPAQGGNGDGVIDSLDAVFKNLRVWIDSNHNGVSERSELYTLEDLGIERIDLSYRDSRRKDRYGNLLRYWSRAWIQRPRGGLKPIDTCDVIFVQAR